VTVAGIESDKVTLVIVGVVAVVLQVLLAPVIVIGPAYPSFIVAAVLLLLVASPDEPRYIFAFVRGMMADLVGGSPVGASAFALLVCAFAVPLLVELVGNDNILMTLLMMLAAAFAYELLYVVVISIAGAVGFPAALTSFLLPCTLYNALLAFLAYLALSRLFTARRSGGGGMTMTNVRFN
jgi:rod shape-determining protein MreD